MIQSQSKWRLDHKKALITGGTKGIGLATAQEFLDLGAEIIITARHQEDIDTCVHRWKSQGLKAVGLASDVSQEAERLRLFDFVRSQWDSLDILINNAGTNQRKPTLEYTDAEVKALFETNLMSAYHFSKLFFPLLRASGQGAIVNISSIAGLSHMRSGSPYGITKAAMLQMTRNLAVEWAPHHIRINSVAPGLTETPLTEFWKTEAQREKTQEFLNKTPLNRMGQSEELASAIAFLAMPAASFITGQCLVVDGGVSINLF